MGSGYFLKKEYDNDNPNTCHLYGKADYIITEAKSCALDREPLERDEAVLS